MVQYVILIDMEKPVQVIDEKRYLKEASSDKSRWPIEVISVAVPAAALTGSALLANRMGISPNDILDQEILLKPPVIKESVDGMVGLNNTIRSVAPIATLGLIGWQAKNSVAGLLGKKDKHMNRLAKLDYSGLDDVTDSEKNGRVREVVRRLGAGTSLAALAMTLAGATSGLEKEISEGPLRPVDSVTRKVADQVPNSNPESVFVLQSPKNTLMDDSSIPEKKLHDMYIQGRRIGVTVVPFSKGLFNVNGESAMQFAVPDNVFEEMSGAKVDKSCDDIPVIVDQTVDAEVGDSIYINGVKAKVVKVEEDNNVAQMNRSIVTMADTDLKKCVQGGANSSYFGAIIPDADKSEVEELIQKLETDGLTAVDQGEFRNNNREFWQANGTPLVLQLMGYLALFGAFAAAGQRRSMLEHNKNEIGSLMAAGVSGKSIEQIEVRRTLSDSLRAGAIAAPLMPLVTAAFNASSSGLSTSVGPREWATGVTMITAANLIATKYSVNQFKKKLDLASAVKG